MNERRIQSIASLLWSMTVITAMAAIYAWFGRTPDGSGGPTPKDGPRKVPGTITVDLETYVHAPPIPGPPDPAEVDAAIEKGRKAYVEKYLLPYLARAEEGGYLVYEHADGRIETLGPQIFVQCQLYILTHFLMYYQELGFAREDPLVVRVHRWLLDNMDREKGRWLWSEEGCLQPKSLYVLASFGDAREFEAGWNWALHSEVYRPDLRLFSMMQSGNIVQSLGPASRSLSGKFGWEHGSNLPDEENTAKYLYALLKQGRSPESPEVLELCNALSDWLASNPMPIGMMRTPQIVGRVWTVFAHLDYRLPSTPGFRISHAMLRACLPEEWRSNLMLRAVPLFRAKLVRALMKAGDDSEELHAIIHGFVDSQDPDGSWPLVHTYGMWSLDAPPARGYKYGNFDASNTYAMILALLAYRDFQAKRLEREAER